MTPALAWRVDGMRRHLAGLGYREPWPHARVGTSGGPGTCLSCNEPVQRPALRCELCIEAALIVRGER